MTRKLVAAIVWLDPAEELPIASPYR